MTQRHTPGPWHARRLRDNDGAPYATQYQAHIDIGVCMVWAPLGNEEQEANAALIAAAPSLLDALQTMMRTADAGKRPLAARKKARAAIELALGHNMPLNRLAEGESELK